MPKRDFPQDRYLHKAYLTPSTPGAFAGLQTFAKARRIKDLKALERSLSKLPTFSRYRAPRTVYPRVPVITKSALENVQIDLIDYSRLKKYNFGYSYILVGICTFTKFAVTIATRSKGVKHMLPALKELIKEFSKGGKVIKNLNSDFGNEFYSNAAQQLFRQLKINHYSVYSNLKSQTVERFIRTYKIRLQRALDHNKTKNWYKLYKSITINYNSSPHRSHGFVPGKIKKSDHDQILANLYKKFILMKRRKPKYIPGSVVRIANRKLKTFTKKHFAHWSEEVFRVKCVSHFFPVPAYKIEDLSGNLIDGTFVEAELTPAAIQNESG